MTEAEWLACTDPQSMLEFVSDKASDRKLRLFATACCRRVWHLLDPEACHAVELAELFADGKMDWEQLAIVNEALDGLFFADGEPDLASQAAFVASAESIKRYVHHVTWDTARVMALSGRTFCPPSKSKTFDRTVKKEQAKQCRLLRDTIYNPFRPQLFLDSSWLIWADNTVPRIAQRIYNECAFDHLPILADALEEAGCINADILNHCRQPGKHVRGCWVIDLLLGKE